MIVTTDVLNINCSIKCINVFVLMFIGFCLFIFIFVVTVVAIVMVTEK